MEKMLYSVYENGWDTDREVLAVDRRDALRQAANLSPEASEWALDVASMRYCVEEVPASELRRRARRGSLTAAELALAALEPRA